MRVTCNSRARKSLPELPGLIHPLTVGREYVVTAILVSVDTREQRTEVLLQLIDDRGDPSWHPSELFTTTSSVIPSNWVAVIHENGALHEAPQSWLEAGFWERWYTERYGGRERGFATEIFERELEVIIRESS